MLFFAFIFVILDPVSGVSGLDPGFLISDSKILKVQVSKKIFPNKSRKTHFKEPLISTDCSFHFSVNNEWFLQHFFTSLTHVLGIFLDQSLAITFKNFFFIENHVEKGGSKNDASWRNWLIKDRNSLHQKKRKFGSVFMCAWSEFLKWLSQRHEVVGSISSRGLFNPFAR